MALDPSTEDFTKILDFTVQLARSAGVVILAGSDAILSVVTDVGEKKNSVDLVTEWDVKVENHVRKEIATAYPAFKL
jgi:myo-inositol-1(or 4)-monophosphatase